MNKQYTESFNLALSIEADANRFWDALRSFLTEPSSGIKRLKEAAELGSALSMYHVGEAYLEGRGIEKDIEQGFKWLQLSADNGFLEGAYQIARTYWAMGDMGKTIKILTDLSDRGHALSMNNLAYLYFFEPNFENLKLSDKYFRMAVKNGNLISSRLYSVLLMQGKFGFYNRLRGFIIWISGIVPTFLTMIRYPRSDRLRIK